MKKPYLLLSFLALFALLLHPQSTVARHLKPPPEPETHTLITSISSDSITVQEPKESKTYKIDKFTEITYNGQLAKVADLKAGMRVEVTPGADATVASRIAASDAPKK